MARKKKPLTSSGEIKLEKPTAILERQVEFNLKLAKPVLGSVDISSEPNQGTDKMKKRQIAFRQLVKAGKNAPEMLDFVEETLN